MLKYCCNNGENIYFFIGRLLFAILADMLAIG